MRSLFQDLFCIALAVPLLQGADQTAEIRRLSVSSFPAAPKQVSDWLKTQECSIPQAEVDANHKTTANNLISGEFAAKGQKDWAALCSHNGLSAIVVLWGGESRCGGALAVSADNHSMQTGVGGKWIYSRLISAIGPQQILKRQKAFGGSVPSPLVHQGIDDAFVGKASVTYYCHKGTWLELQGTD
jgi:hypothetical protein